MRSGGGGRPLSPAEGRIASKGENSRVLAKRGEFKARG